MTETRKRFRLRGMVYDEVSFVDNGANQHADVLLVKRNIQKSRPSESSGGGGPSKTADWYHGDRTPTDASGNKTDLRAQHWEQSRHPRDIRGQWAQTSPASKKKYGKGGTTGKHQLTPAEKAAKKAAAAKRKKLAAERKALALKNKKVGYRLVMGPGGKAHWEHVKASLATTKKPPVSTSGTVKVRKYLGVDAATQYLERG